MAGLRYESTLGAPVEEAFAWHERPGAVERLLPPWEPVRVDAPPAGLAEGSQLAFRLAVPGPVAPRWVARHAGYDPPHEFRDVQVRGPFRSWQHRHRFEPADGGQTLLADEVDYELPCRRATGVADPLVRNRLHRVFTYRHRQLADDLAAHQAAEQRGMGGLRVAVTGASGLIGRALTALLTSGGHQVLRMVRHRARGSDELSWDPDTGSIDAAGLRGLDAVIHLAGAPIGRPWTPEHKQRIRDSRVDGTHLLATTLAELDGGPRVLVCGSAIGFYGYDRGDEQLTEGSASGEGFLADVVRAWEAAADPAREAGLRVVHVRTGIVQSPRGGTLGLQLPLFLAGAGGRLGSGDQWMSWVSIDDIIGIFHHALTSPEVRGAVNGTAPHPVTNAEYTATLGRVLGRPAVVPVPPLGPRLLFGNDGARETALADQRVLPERAGAGGYTFRQGDLETALRHLLGRRTVATARLRVH